MTDEETQLLVEACAAECEAWARKMLPDEEQQRGTLEMQVIRRAGFAVAGWLRLNADRLIGKE